MLMSTWKGQHWSVGYPFHNPYFKGNILHESNVITDFTPEFHQDYPDGTIFEPCPTIEALAGKVEGLDLGPNKTYYTNQRYRGSIAQMHCAFGYSPFMIQMACGEGPVNWNGSHWIVSGQYKTLDGRTHVDNPPRPVYPPALLSSCLVSTTKCPKQIRYSTFHRKNA